MSGESLAYERIYSLVYDWGKENHVLPNLKTEEDQIKHFGKRIEDFTDDEWRGYDNGCYDLEYYFEVIVPHMIEVNMDCL